jgi:hypothetical protein
MRVLRSPLRSRVRILGLSPGGFRGNPGRPAQEVLVKKVFGLFAVLAAIGGALMFWRKRQTDDEFLDEELE